jgi:hypothetical protein
MPTIHDFTCRNIGNKARVSGNDQPQSRPLHVAARRLHDELITHTRHPLQVPFQPPGGWWRIKARRSSVGMLRGVVHKLPARLLLTAVQHDI